MGFEDIAKIIEKRRSTIANNCGADPELIKGLTVEDFNKKYADYATYTEEQIRKFTSDIQKSVEDLSKEESAQAIQKAIVEISHLTPKKVVKDGLTKVVYVDLEKGSHKYFKREGTAGSYKYYYTEAEYKQAKGTQGEKSHEHSTSLKVGNEVKESDGSLKKVREINGNMVHLEGERDPIHISKLYKKDGSSVIEKEGDKNKAKSSTFEQGFVDKEGKETEENTKPKDATDHIIDEGNGTFTIDALDPDTEEKKFKEGDKIHFKTDDGKKKTGTVGKETEDGIHEVQVDEEDLPYSHKNFKPQSKEHLEKKVKEQYAKSPLNVQKEKVREAMEKHYPEKNN